MYTSSLLVEYKKTKTREVEEKKTHSRRSGERVQQRETEKERESERENVPSNVKIQGWSGGDFQNQQTYPQRVNENEVNGDVCQLVYRCKPAWMSFFFSHRGSRNQRLTYKTASHRLLIGTQAARCYYCRSVFPIYGRRGVGQLMEWTRCWEIRYYKNFCA